MKKNLIVIATACTMLVGCGGNAGNYQQPEEQVEVQTPRIPDSLLIVTDDEFKKYKLVELKANPLDHLADGFGATFHIEKKYGYAEEFKALYICKAQGARSINKIDILIDGELYYMMINTSSRTKDGRVLAQSMPYEDWFPVLAKADKAMIKVSFDNGLSQEKELSAEDLKNYKDMFWAYNQRAAMQL